MKNFRLSCNEMLEVLERVQKGENKEEAITSVIASRKASRKDVPHRTIINSIKALAIVIYKSSDESIESLSKSDFLSASKTASAEALSDFLKNNKGKEVEPLKEALEEASRLLRKSLCKGGK